MMSRRGLDTTTTTTTTKTAAAAATTPTTSALLKESRQLLLKQQLKLQLNINVSEMMDNLRRSVVDDYNNAKQQTSCDGDLSNLNRNLNLNLNLARVQEEEVQLAAAAAMTKGGGATNAGTENGQQNKLDTVTTVPQLQQKFNKFNIIEATTTGAATTTTTTTLATLPSLSSSSPSAALMYTSLTQKHSQNTALAKFNRIIDNTVPVINNYQQQQQQQHVAETTTTTFTKTSQHLQQQQQQQLQQQQLEMPMLSDSLKRRLASHHYTDLIVVNNSKINFSSDRQVNVVVTTNTTTTTTTATTSQPPSSRSSRSSAISSSSSPQRKAFPTAEARKVGAEDKQLKRNDVHYLLKQLNSFSDIEEIEIVDMKQKQRQQQQKLIRDKQQQHEQEQQQQQHQHLQQQQYAEHIPHTSQQNQSLTKEESAKVLADIDRDRRTTVVQQILTVNLPPQPSTPSHCTANAFAASASQASAASALQYSVSSSTLPQYISSYSQDRSDLSLCVQLPLLPSQHDDSEDATPTQQHIADGAAVVGAAGLGGYAPESKQHFQDQATWPTSSPSPTATSLVIYSPSSQSHKGIRRYASLHQQQQSADDDDDGGRVDGGGPHDHLHYHAHHYHHRRHHTHHTHTSHHHPHHPHLRLPHEHYSEGSILDSVAARAAACDPLALQQFVDDYIFQSCHYLEETNNFAANYCTAMVESSSHEFRPSTTTTTRTSNEEYDDEECYVEDHSSAHSFELHECEPPTVICKAPAPALHVKVQEAPSHIRASMRHLAPLSSAMPPLPPPPQYTMETRLCSSGVQTDLTASSLAQSFSLSSSLSSSEQRKRRQPIFKCCYTPLDRWREKRQQQQQQQQQIQLKKRTKTVTSQQQFSSSLATNSTTTTTATTMTTSCLKNTSVAVVGVGGAVRVGDGGGKSNGGGNANTAVTTSATTTTAASTAIATTSIVVHSQHHSLPTKNAPYAV